MTTHHQRNQKHPKTESESNEKILLAKRAQRPSAAAPAESEQYDVQVTPAIDQALTSVEQRSEAYKRRKTSNDNEEPNSQRSETSSAKLQQSSALWSVCSNPCTQAQEAPQIIP